MIYFTISASISIICAISFWWSKHSAFVQHHVNDDEGTNLKYHKKLKKISLEDAPERTRFLRPDMTPPTDIRHKMKSRYPHDKWMESDSDSDSDDYKADHDLMDYRIDLASTPVIAQMKGIKPRQRPLSYDTVMGLSPHGTERIQVVDVERSVTLPVLVALDTPHALAHMIRPDPFEAFEKSRHNKYLGVNQLQSPSISYVSDDDILTPLQGSVNLKMSAKAYGSIDDDAYEHSLSSRDTRARRPLKSNKKRVFVFEGRKSGGKTGNYRSATKHGQRKRRGRGGIRDTRKLPKYMVKHHRFNFRKYIYVFSNIKYLVLSLWLSMFITFLWFPGVVSNVKSSFNVINADGKWMAIIMVTEFNVVDFIGRQYLSSYTPKWLKEKNLWTFALLRITTYPVFLLFFKGYIVNDYILHLVMIISALSNGWIASLSFMWFPRNIHKRQQQIGASIMTLGLAVGILSGSSVALIVQPYITEADFL